MTDRGREPDRPGRGRSDSLRRVKILHTAIWAFFASCILAIPIFTALSRLTIAAVLAAIVALEVAVLLFNGMTCPLTDVAAQFTEDRRPNFDIYLPEWIARNNKTIFGALYFASLVHLVAVWLGVP